MTSLGTDGGAPKSSYWLLASMLPSVLYKEEVQHRGVRIHAGPTHGTHFQGLAADH